MQLTWRSQDGISEPIVTAVAPQADPLYPVELINEIPLGNGWTHSTYTWRIYPNPPDETFFIEGNINVDELVVDTWCIPEPATLGLFLLGSLVLVRRRRL